MTLAERAQHVADRLAAGAPSAEALIESALRAAVAEELEALPRGCTLVDSRVIIARAVEVREGGQ